MDNKSKYKQFLIDNYNFSEDELESIVDRLDFIIKYLPDTSYEKLTEAMILVKNTAYSANLSIDETLCLIQESNI